MQLPKIPLTVLDTETTGFVPRVHHVMEFASMRADDGKVTSEFEALLSVPDEIPPHVQALTRIRTADIAGKPTIADRKDDIVKAIGTDTLIVGQNIAFDIGMLKGEGIDLSDRPNIDTSMLAALVFPELPSYSLGYVSQVLKLNHEPVHRALGDVRATLELLGHCWERMCLLPKDRLEELRDVLGRGSEGYRMLAAALPTKGGTLTLTMPAPEHCAECTQTHALPLPGKGEVAFQEEDLHPAFLHRVLREATEQKKGRTFVAVKNLEALLRRCVLPEGVSVLFPPFLLPHPEAVEALETQKTLSADEATLLLKLKWFAPKTRADLALHGGEKELWAGRIACTETCDGYKTQFTTLTNTVLVDQRQLLQFLREPSPETEAALKGARVVIDDASMFEETATKGFGAVCALQELRAAAADDAVLQKLADMLSLWTEKTRSGQDMRFLAPSDLEHHDGKALSAQIQDYLASHTPSAQAQRLLKAALVILDPKHLSGNVTWIEVWQNGATVLQSYPERIDALLGEHLFSKHPTTLILPRGTHRLPLVVPQNAVIVEHTLEDVAMCSVAFPEGTTAEQWFTEPADGKTVVLLASRKAIEQCYVKHVEALEKKGVTLLCQGLSGSTGRMEAEFAAANGKAICVLTPWTYEGFELPPETVSNLVLDLMPFDSPSQPLIQARSKFLPDAFTDYLLPKLEHRLFRLLRTLRRHAKDTPAVTVLDDRLRTKQYGGRVQAYLEAFSAESAPKAPAPKTKGKQPSLF